MQAPNQVGAMAAQTGGGGGSGDAAATSAAAAEKAAPAASASDVTSALTLRGAQLSSSILHGHKRVENRQFVMRPGWYALHTGQKMDVHESQLPLLRSIAGLPSEQSLPHSSIVGAIEISHALSQEQCQHVEPWASGPVGNVIARYCRLQTPVAHAGKLAPWRIDDDAVARVQEQLAHATVVANDISHLPGPDAQPTSFAAARHQAAAQAVVGPSHPQGNACDRAAAPASDAFDFESPCNVSACLCVAAARAAGVFWLAARAVTAQACVDGRIRTEAGWADQLAVAVTQLPDDENIAPP